MFLSFKIQSFSSNHKLHLFDPPVYEIYCFITDQVISKSCLFSFNLQIYFDSSVSFEYLLWLKDLMWFLYRSLNVLALMLMKCYAICVVCSDCGLVNYALSHAFCNLCLEKSFVF